MLGDVAFTYPWLLSLPLLYFVVALWRKIPGDSLAFPATDIFSGVGRSWRVIFRGPVLGAFLFVCLFALGIAAARPIRLNPFANEAQARNIMLALDISRSMSAEDFGSLQGRMSRLDGVKEVVMEFIDARPQDRIGLIVFGQRALVQCPLTRDHALLLRFVEALRVGLAGDGTAIGDGLGLALKRIKDVPGEAKTVVLLTDGVSNAGEVNPIQAARVAKDLGVKVHSIGIGSANPVNIAIPQGIFGRAFQSQVEFDEETLKEIASISGGVYFNADNRERLSQVYQAIDKLEQTDNKDLPQNTIDDLSATWAAIGAAALLCYFLLAKTIFLRVP